jgi:hypothetical protein
MSPRSFISTQPSHESLSQHLGHHFDGNHSRIRRRQGNRRLLPRIAITRIRSDHWQIVDSIHDGRGVIDSRNGYMFLDGDGAQVSLEIALFLYPDREPLLAVAWADYMEGSEKPPYQIKNFTHLSFYRERSGKMVLRTARSFQSGIPAISGSSCPGKG